MEQKIVDSGLVKTNLKANCKEEAIRELSKGLIERGCVEEGFCEAVLEREKIYPTGVEGKFINFALPHTDIKYVKRTSFGVGILEDSLKFNSIEKPDKEIEVKVIILLANRNPSLQPAILKNLINFFQDKTYVESLLQKQNPEEVAELLNKCLTGEDDCNGES